MVVLYYLACVKKRAMQSFLSQTDLLLISSSIGRTCNPFLLPSGHPLPRLASLLLRGIASSGLRVNSWYPWFQPTINFESVTSIKTMSAVRRRRSALRRGNMTLRKKETRASKDSSADLTTHGLIQTKKGAARGVRDVLEVVTNHSPCDGL